MRWFHRRPTATVICPGCAAPVATYGGRIVFHAPGRYRKPTWVEVASELAPLSRWCPASDELIEEPRPSGVASPSA